MPPLKHSSVIVFISAVGVSLVLHLSGLISVTPLATLLSSREPLTNHTIKMKIAPKPQESTKPEPPPLPPKKTPTPPKKPEQRKAAKKVQKNAPKVQGVTADSVIQDPNASSTFAVPLGNTLMKKDEGQRLRPEEVAALERNLSSDALLIQGSFEVPEYTQEAIDVEIEGRFVVDVFVNDEGTVQQAELRRQIGYGMDERVLIAARSAKFIPRKDAKGIPISGWAEILFFLEIP